MAAGTNVQIQDNLSQFRGVFDRVWVVRFTLDTGSITSNSNAEDTVAIPGIDRNNIVLGFTYENEPPADVIHEVHVASTDVLHIVTHNVSGGATNPPSNNWTVVIGRLVI